MSIQIGTVNKTVTIDYSKAAIIAAFNAIQEKAKYTYYKANDSFGMIEFNIINGVNPFKVSITLNEVQVGKTTMEVILSRSSGSQVDNNTMLSVFMELMNVIDKQLKGEHVSDADIKKGKGGCMVLVPLLLAIGSAAVYLLMLIL